MNHSKLKAAIDAAKAELEIGTPSCGIVGYPIEEMPLVDPANSGPGFLAVPIGPMSLEQWEALDTGNEPVPEQAPQAPRTPERKRRRGEPPTGVIVV
ncbi:MAG: hypothetical protein AAGJ54_08200 [Planctomycetota bacterium]